jgi:hypothetical protein
MSNQLLPKNETATWIVFSSGFRGVLKLGSRSVVGRFGPSPVFLPRW